MDNFLKATCQLRYEMTKLPIILYWWCQMSSVMLIKSVTILKARDKIWVHIFIKKEKHPVKSDM